MNYNTIKVRYTPVRSDVWTEVTVRDYFGNTTSEQFENEKDANEFIRNQPGDYFVYDFRNNQDVAEGYYVRSVRV